VVHKIWNQIDEGTLSGSTRSDDGDGFAARNYQADVVAQNKAVVPSVLLVGESKIADAEISVGLRQIISVGFILNRRVCIE